MSKLRFSSSAAVLLCWVAPAALPAADVGRFEFRDGDRVVLLGGTFIERMQVDNHLEALLTLSHAERNLTFRNLGWSGDTVWGESRALFGTQADGFKRLIQDVRQVEPTVLMIAYGANEANAGPAGVGKFVDGLNRLLDALAETRARTILLAPLARGRPSPRLPDPGPYNAALADYRRAIEEVARHRGAWWIDAAGALERGAEGLYAPDGVQLTPLGNYRVAAAISQALGGSGELPGDRAEQLRGLMRAKNELYFHRYRPQNETYLLLFRKHEQGNNAVEIPQFDPLVAAKDAEIHRLSREVRGSERSR
jgi:hypothetical protein